MQSTKPSVLIVGTGFGGIAAAIELGRHGYTNVTLLEKASEIGGVWRENTYPGAACDVPSPLYSYSYAPNPNWSKRYSPQPEILAYLKATAANYGVDKLVHFNCEVISAEFDEVTAKWRVSTTAGQSFTADVLVPALGQLSKPSWPEIAGRESFVGPTLHSAMWDHSVDLVGKRVAVIGTGASAIQFVPALVPTARTLTLFQRSAPWMLPQPQKHYTRVHHWMFRNLPVMERFERLSIWLLVELLQKAMSSRSRISMPLGAAIAKTKLRLAVKDRQLRAKLTPDYPAGCKRMLFSNRYLKALAKPNVEVVTDRIAEITSTGVRTADGTEHAVDVIVYGTGFVTNDFHAPMTVRGLGGVDLDVVWKDGAHAYFGMCVPGFPNMFMMYGPNTNLGSGSIISMLEPQATYIRQAVDALAGSGGGYLDIRPEIEHACDVQTQERMKQSVWVRCSSWYRNADGRVAANWPGSVKQYRMAVAQFKLDEYLQVKASVGKHVA